VNSDPYVNSSFFWKRNVELSSALLDVVGAFYRVECARKIHQERVAYCLDLSTGILVEDGAEQLSLLI